MSNRVFGEIDGYPEGSHFVNRITLSEARVHCPREAGISGSQYEGSDSIVLSGGYHDEDFGTEIKYTGHGGRERGSTTHTSDQHFTRGNKALSLNKDTGLPVRVIRGYNHQSSYSPETGYRYDGLFRVDDYWSEIGKDHGFKVYRFYLIKIDPHSSENIQETVVLPTGESKRRTITTQVVRVVRDTALSRSIKRLYNFSCQVCGKSIIKRTGPYAEGAHIKPLGEPHNGPDISENILCLCPNHHVMFDGGGFGINDDLSLIGINGILTVNQNHDVGLEFLEYHRSIHEL